MARTENTRVNNSWKTGLKGNIRVEITYPTGKPFSVDITPAEAHTMAANTLAVVTGVTPEAGTMNTRARVSHKDESLIQVEITYPKGRPYSVHITPAEAHDFAHNVFAVLAGVKD